MVAGRIFFYKKKRGFPRQNQLSFFIVLFQHTQISSLKVLENNILLLKRVVLLVVQLRLSACGSTSINFYIIALLVLITIIFTALFLKTPARERKQTKESFLAYWTSPQGEKKYQKIVICAFNNLKNPFCKHTVKSWWLMALSGLKTY